MADGDLLARLEEVELAELGRVVDRALVGAPRRVERAQLAHVVVEDRLAARIALLLDQLADPLGRDPRVLLQQALDLLAERVELRRPGRARIVRRLARLERAADRLAVKARAAVDLVG